MKLLVTRALRFNEARATQKYHLLLRVAYACVVQRSYYFTMNLQQSTQKQLPLKIARALNNN